MNDFIQSERTFFRPVVDKGPCRPIDRFRDAALQSIVRMARCRRRRRIPHQPVLAVIGVRLDIPARLLRAGGAVALQVVGVRISIVLEELVVGVRVLERRHVGRGAVAFLVVGVVFNRDGRAGACRQHALVRLHEVVELVASR